jgi:hypothetical protein
VFYFGAIPVGERGIGSKRNASVEVIPRALQITELATREPAFIENFGEVWIEPDQSIEIYDRARPIGHLH